MNIKISALLNTTKLYFLFTSDSDSVWAPSSTSSFIILNLWPAKWGQEKKRAWKDQDILKNPDLEVTYLPSAHMPMTRTVSWPEASLGRPGRGSLPASSGKRNPSLSTLQHLCLNLCVNFGQCVHSFQTVLL